MKKIFTLMVSMVLLTSAFAQFGSRDNGQQGYDKDKFVRGDNRGGFGGGYFFSAKDRDMQIAAINNNFDYKIAEVNHRLFAGRFKKNMLINELQDARQREIAAVWAKFKDHSNKYFDGRFDGRRNW